MWRFDEEEKEWGGNKFKPGSLEEALSQLSPKFLRDVKVKKAWTEKRNGVIVSSVLYRLKTSKELSKT